VVLPFLVLFALLLAGHGVVMGVGFVGVVEVRMEVRGCDAAHCSFA